MRFNVDFLVGVAGLPRFEVEVDLHAGLLLAERAGTVTTTVELVLGLHLTIGSAKELEELLPYFGAHLILIRSTSQSGRFHTVCPISTNYRRNGLRGRYPHPVSVLNTHVERDSDVFTSRQKRMQALVDEVRERTAQIARGGGEKAVERHRSRGKPTARERVDRLSIPAAPSSS